MLKKIFIFIFTVILILFARPAKAVNYFVSPGGDDQNSGFSTSQSWKTIAKANNSLLPGDTVFIMAGTYNYDAIKPINSGSQNALITYKNNGNDNVVITGPGYGAGADLANKSYIVIDGINFENIGQYWFNLEPSGSHNTVKNCHMKGAGNWAGIILKSRSDYNKILNNEFTASAENPCGPNDSVLIWNSSYNLIEGNYFGNAGHDALDMQDEGISEKNIIKNNVFQNKWHSNFDLWASGNLVENNIFLDGGENHSDNLCGSDLDRNRPRWEHGGLKITSSNNIIRYNIMANNGFNSLEYYGEKYKNINNHIYNNTITDNVYGLYSNNADPLRGNILKNNIFFNDINNEIYQFLTNSMAENYFFGNDIAGAPISINFYGNHGLAFLQENYPNIFNNNLSADPLFADPANDDYSLSAGSPLIDKGLFLTETAEAGGGNVLPVLDAAYFSGGFGIVDGDIIKIEGVNGELKIIAVDLVGNKLTLDKSASWEKGKGVYQAYIAGKPVRGLPDIGAFEFQPAGNEVNQISGNAENNSATAISENKTGSNSTAGNGSPANGSSSGSETSHSTVYDNGNNSNVIYYSGNINQNTNTIPGAISSPEKNTSSSSAIISPANMGEGELINSQKNRVHLDSSAKKSYEKLMQENSYIIKNQSSKFAAAYFIQNGTLTTNKMGLGERAGTIASFASAYGRMPETIVDWQDIIKIAGGRWPSQKSAAAENKASAVFKKVYLRAPNRSDAHDDVSIMVIAYGLRPSRRNLNSEVKAAQIFNRIYNRKPQSAGDWDIVRAISYSGVRR